MPRPYGVVVLAVLFSISAGCGKSIPSFAGPYILYVSRVEDCKQVRKDIHVSHSVRLSSYNPYKPYDGQILSGNVTVPEAVDDSWWGSMKLDVRSNNQWKSNAFTFNFTSKFCSRMRLHAPSYFQAAFKPVGTDTKQCRIPVGTYVMQKERVRWEFPQVPIMPYGHYRAHNVGGKGARLLACYLVENHVLPQP